MKKLTEMNVELLSDNEIIVTEGGHWYCEVADAVCDFGAGVAKGFVQACNDQRASWNRFIESLYINNL